MSGKTKSQAKPRGNFKTKNTMVKIKNSLGELNNTMKMSQEKVSELEDQLTEIIQSEKQRKKRQKKMAKPQTCEVPSKDLIFVSSKFWKEKKKSIGQKTYLEKQELSVLNPARDKDSRGSVNSKENKPKKFTPRHITIKPLKSKDKNLKSSQRRTTQDIRGNNYLNDYRLLIRNQIDQKAVEHFSRAKRK